MKEQIVTGRKFRILADVTSRLWHVISFWTKAQDVEFNNGNNAQTTLGNITGISDSLTSTSSNIAASAAAVKVLNDKIVNQIGNLDNQLNQKNQQINNLNGQVSELNNQLNQANQLIKDLQAAGQLSSLSGNTSGSGYKYVYKINGGGSSTDHISSVAGGGFFKFDNSKTKFRYVRVVDDSDINVWDTGSITITANGHNLLRKEHKWDNTNQWHWETIIGAHDYDMGTNPPSTIEIGGDAGGSPAGSSGAGSVYGTVTLSFWGQQL